MTEAKNDFNELLEQFEYQKRVILDLESHQLRANAYAEEMEREKMELSAEFSQLQRQVSFLN